MKIPIQKISIGIDLIKFPKHVKAFIKKIKEIRRKKYANQ